MPPKISQKIIESISEDSGFNVQDSEQFLKLGQAYLKTESISDEIKYTNSPAHIVHKEFSAKTPFKLNPGINATFFLAKEGLITHAVINGFLLDLNKPLKNQNFKNALIYRK